MASAAKNLQGNDLRPHQLSTVPPPFNQKDAYLGNYTVNQTLSAQNATEPRVSKRQGMLIRLPDRETETVTAASGNGTGAMAPTFDRILMGLVKPGGVMEVLCRHYNRDRTEDPLEKPRFATRGNNDIRSALAQVRGTVAQNKVSAQASAAEVISRNGASPEIVDRAIRMLLSEHRSGDLDDATDILTLLGHDVVGALAESRLSTYPPDGTNDDYWYVIIRAAGRTCNRDIVKRFLDSRFLAIAEATVWALGDIGDAEALEDLKLVAKDSSRPEIIREIAQELVSDPA